jgi:hypothetical protein
MAAEEQTGKTAVAEPIARAAIRRFDVFAEYTRLRNEAKGMSETASKAEALWLAKFVAGRKFATAAGHEAAFPARPTRQPGVPAPVGVKSLDGKPQTAELFDREIVDRMGPEFYARVFAPAVAHAYHSGEKYEVIRDQIRASWNLKRS